MAGDVRACCAPCPGHGPDRPARMGAGAVPHRDAHAGVQLARRDHQLAAGVPGAGLRAAPVADGHRGARCRAGALLRGVLAGGCSAVAPVRGRAGTAGRPVPAGCGAAGARRAARCAAVSRHRGGRWRDRADERTAAQPGQAAPPRAGGPADRDLPAQHVRRVGAWLADRGPGVPGFRRVAPADPRAVGAARPRRGAGMAAPVAVPDGTGQPGRRPASTQATSEDVQAPAGMAGHGLHGAAEPDLLHSALVAADPVAGPGRGSGTRGLLARLDEPRWCGHRTAGPGPRPAGR